MKEREHSKILDYYSSEYYFTYSHMDDSELEQWKDRKIAGKYLENYWLSDAEYNSVWKPIQASLFDPLALNFPDLLFRRDLHIFALAGGETLVPEALEKVNYLVNTSSEDNFALIQNTIVSDDPTFPPQLRFKYPPSICRGDLMSGRFISTVLFEMPHNDYFIFGGSGLWAGYAANDYEIPVFLLAIDNSLVSVAKDILISSEHDAEELKKIIPDNYKATYRIHF